MLVQKRVKALVLRRRQIEHGEEFAIAARRLPQARVDQVDEILSCQLAGLEWLIHNCPEVLAGRKAVEEARERDGLLIDRSRQRAREIGMNRTELGFLNPCGGPEQVVGGRKVSGDRSAFRLVDKRLSIAFFRHASSVRRFDPFRNAALMIG